MKPEQRHAYRNFLTRNLNSFRSLGMFGALFLSVSIGAGLHTSRAHAANTDAHVADIQILKSKITAIAVANMTRKDNWPEVRAELDPLVAELVRISPQKSEAEIATLNVGAWRQLWTDNFNPEPPGYRSNLAQIYQAVSAQGYLYNFGTRIEDSTGIEQIFMLRGVLSLKGNIASIELTDAYSRPYALGASEVLTNLAGQIEAGTAADVVRRAAGRFPRGPIGAKSEVVVSYIDDEIRITSAANSYTGKTDLFVVTRVVTPATK